MITQQALHFVHLDVHNVWQVQQSVNLSCVWSRRGALICVVTHTRAITCVLLCLGSHRFAIMCVLCSHLCSHACALILMFSYVCALSICALMCLPWFHMFSCVLSLILMQSSCALVHVCSHMCSHSHVCALLAASSKSGMDVAPEAAKCGTNRTKQGPPQVHRHPETFCILLLRACLETLSLLLGGGWCPVAARSKWLRAHAIASVLIDLQCQKDRGALDFSRGIGRRVLMAPNDKNDIARPVGHCVWLQLNYV